MAQAPQNYANHIRFDPVFHYFILPVFAINLIVSIVRLIRFPGLAMAWYFVVSLAAILAVFKIRLNALKAQDRVIRLEERLRLAQLLPEPLRLRIDELTTSQLIALRFACDAEVAGLMEGALASRWSNADIKKAIRVWRPDTFRI